jgi:glycosyltransferase involved in cell wall biosynthesis
VLEAAQAGCALVLSDIHTHRELWDGAALFVEPSDASAFAVAANRLIEDRNERERLGERAWKHSTRYSPDAMARSMTEIYARVTQPELVAGAA